MQRFCLVYSKIIFSILAVVCFGVALLFGLNHATNPTNAITATVFTVPVIIYLIFLFRMNKFGYQLVAVSSVVVVGTIFGFFRYIGFFAQDVARELGGLSAENMDQFQYLFLREAAVFSENGLIVGVVYNESYLLSASVFGIILTLILVALPAWAGRKAQISYA